MLLDSTLATTVGATAVNLAANNPRAVAIDLSGNVWVPTSTGSGYTFEYTAAGSSVAVATSKSPYFVAIDASNNVWVAQESTSTTNSFTEYLGGSLASTTTVTYAAPGANSTLNATYLAFDANGTLWASSGANLGTATNVVQFSNASTAASGCTAYPCQVSATTATYVSVTGLGTQPAGLAATATAMIAADSSAPGGSSVLLSTNAVTNFGTSLSVSTPRYSAVDGAGNIWLSNRGTNSISEFNAAGTPLSPVAPAGKTSPIGFLHATGITAGNGLGIDPSGNVWVADNTTTAGGPVNSIFEIVGAAAPTVTPLAAALKAGTIGQKP